MMEPYIDTGYFTSSLLFDFILLLIMLFTLWTWSETLGYKLSYLLFFTLAVNAILHDFQYLITSEQIRLMVPDVTMLVLTTLLAILFAESERKPTKHAFAASIILLTFGFLFFSDLHLLTILFSFALGIFIVYTASYTTIWLHQAPDLTRLGLSVVFPVSLYLLNPTDQMVLYAGVLTGLGLGYQIEQIKVKIVIKKHHTGKKVLAFLVGAVGISVIGVLLSYFSTMTIHLFLYAFLGGLWMTWIAPYLFVKLHLHDHMHSHQVPYHSKAGRNSL